LIDDIIKNNLLIKMLKSRNVRTRSSEIQNTIPSIQSEVKTQPEMLAKMFSSEKGFRVPVASKHAPTLLAGLFNFDKTIIYRICLEAGVPRAIKFHPYFIYTDCDEVPEKDLEDILVHLLLPFHDDLIKRKKRTSGFCPTIHKSALKAKTPSHARVIIRGALHIKYLMRDKLDVLVGHDSHLQNEVD
jgi:hypothetical protein